jgi:hypothetical protein
MPQRRKWHNSPAWGVFMWEAPAQCSITAFSCPQKVRVPANSRFYRATRLLLIRARIFVLLFRRALITFE